MKGGQDINEKKMNYLRKLISIKLKDRKEEERGILLEEGSEWIIILSLFTDYMLDGYKIINKKYIMSIYQTEDDIFTEKVLDANNKIPTSFSAKIPLTSNQLFIYLYETRTTFQLHLNRESSFYMGYIKEVLPKSFYFLPMNPKGKWLNYHFLFRMTYIRIVEIETDYTNSLLAYNKSTYSE